MALFFDEKVVARHAEMAANRCVKNLRRWRERLAREGTTVFRLYDRDIPEVRVVVDWYDGDLVVAEYERDQTAAIEGYVESIAGAIARAVGVESARVHCKRRRTRRAGRERYGASGRSTEKIVTESGMKFFVELDTHIDTGLFADHRPTRRWLRREASAKRFLNLYGYTGSFTVSAALGGASETVTVDRSAQYLAVARRNLGVNDCSLANNVLVERDVWGFLRDAQRSRERYDLVMVDPPTYSTGGEDPEFDVQRDHRELVELALGVLSQGGKLWFSTNHQRFLPELDGLGLREVTEVTVAEEFRNRNAHRCWITEV